MIYFNNLSKLQQQHYVLTKVTGANGHIVHGAKEYVEELLSVISALNEADVDSLLPGQREMLMAMIPSNLNELVYPLKVTASPDPEWVNLLKRQAMNLNFEELYRKTKENGNMVHALTGIPLGVEVIEHEAIDFNRAVYDGKVSGRANFTTKAFYEVNLPGMVEDDFFKTPIETAVLYTL